MVLHLSMPLYLREFPDIDFELDKLTPDLPKGWEDSSWHNDACPCWAHADHEGVTLWADYEDPAKGEFEDARKAGEFFRFELNTWEGERLFGTNDWSEMAAEMHRRYPNK